MTLLCLVAVWCLGFGVVRFLFPTEWRWSLDNLVLASLGAGVGVGIASLVYFACLVLAGPKFGLLASAEGAVFVLAVSAGLVARRRQGKWLDWAPGPAAPTYIQVLFWVAVGLAAVMFVVYALNKPQGEWDAWSIWNLRARFLVRSGDMWRNAFSTQIAWSHPDYPLLISGIVAMCWTLAGESSLAAAGVAFMFTFSTAALLIAVVGVLRGKLQAMIAGALLAGTVTFVQIGAMQYVDVPLSFYILSAVSLIVLAGRYGETWRFSVLAGLMAGLAAWTKNEGLLFVASLVAACLIAALRFGSKAFPLRGLAGPLAGLVAPLAAVGFFKLRLAPPNDLVTKSGREILAHVADPGRWIMLAEGTIKAALQFGSFLIPVVGVLALYWFLVRFQVAEENRAVVGFTTLAAGLMLAGDILVYVLFPTDIAWQLNTSIDRLYLQIWPLGLLAFFLASRVPALATAPVSEKAKPAKRAGKATRRAAG